MLLNFFANSCNWNFYYKLHMYAYFPSIKDSNKLMPPFITYYELMQGI